MIHLIIAIVIADLIARFITKAGLIGMLIIAARNWIKLHDADAKVAAAAKDLRAD